MHELHLLATNDVNVAYARGAVGAIVETVNGVHRFNIANISSGVSRSVSGVTGVM